MKIKQRYEFLHFVLTLVKAAEEQIMPYYRNCVVGPKVEPYPRRRQPMPNFAFWQRWLLAVGLAVSAFGVLMALLSGAPVFELLTRQIDSAFWSAGVPDEATRQFQHWLYGVWGATIAGWGIFLTYIVRYPFSQKERWAWNCLAFGLAIWFVLDTSLSLFHKVYFNAVFNTALLVLAGLPVMFTRQYFTQKGIPT